MKDSRLHIAYLVSTLGRSGPTRQLLYLIRHLDPKHFRVTLITLSPEPPDSLIDTFTNLGIAMRCLTNKKTNNLLLIRKRLVSLFGEVKPDLLHTQGVRADFCGTLLGLEGLHISSQRNDPFEEYPPLYGLFLGTVLALLHVWSLRRVSQVVTCSQTLAEKNRRYRLRSIFIRNGVDLSLTATKGAQLRPQKGSGFFQRFDQKHVFIYSGPLVARKQPKMLIQAFTELPQQDKALVVLGEGPLFHECQQIANGQSNIFLAGSVPNVVQYLQQCGCYISASMSEGLPNSVLEAFATGLPAILSDIPAHRELQRLVPKAVTLYNLDNPTTLQKAIGNFVQTNNVKEVLSKGIQSHFDARLMSRKYQELYKRLTPQTNVKAFAHE